MYNCRYHQELFIVISCCCWSEFYVPLASVVHQLLSTPFIFILQIQREQPFYYSTFGGGWWALFDNTIKFNKLIFYSLLNSIFTLAISDPLMIYLLPFPVIAITCDFNGFGLASSCSVVIAASFTCAHYKQSNNREEDHIAAASSATTHRAHNKKEQ